MNDSALDILAGTFKKQETLTDINTYTFESKITVLDKNIGAGCPVHVFEKATGTLIYTTETDSESFIYVPNLLKNIKYFVVATDKNDTYSSIIFDLNWDFAQQSGNKYNLKYYNKYQASGSKDIYTYTDTVSDLVYDPSLLYSISVPFQKEDQKATWFATGIFNVENIDGFPSFSFKGSASTYTYINFTPVQTGDSFTVECYIRPLALFSGKTVAGGVFSQNTSQGLFISDDFRLSYKNKNLTINTISTLEEDTWYHVAVSYDSKRIRLFLNGKKEAETEDSVGLEYLSTVFCVGAGFYGYLSGFKIFQESKYEEDFTPSFRPFGHLPVIYTNEEDPYANNTVLKSYISDSGYLKDKAKNTPLSFDYTIPKDSYIVSNNSFIRTPTQYADLALNGDFTIEVKFRLLYRTGTNPVIFGNKASKTEWATNNWHLHADHPSQLEKYGLSIYGGNYNNSLANYPTIYNEPVSLVLQRKGTTYSYYFNGFADRSFTYANAMDTRTSSYFSIGGDTSFELYDIKVTKGVARYSENYKDEQLRGSEALLKAYYQIVNYPFKESLYDARNALAFVNTGVLLTSDRSSYNSKSAFFANSYFVTSKSYWYTPNESFTVEFKISCSTLPLTTDDIINTATLFSIFTATSDNFKLAIRDKYLSFYNGIEWLDSEFELDAADTFKHIVLQRNSTSIKILAEGSLVLETTCPDLAGRRNVSIGANKAGSDTFNGYMNNLFIYKNYCKYEDNYQVPEDPDEYVPIEEEKEPEVIVTPFTTSALNFEKGLIDQIGTTIWNKEGTADITSVNKIFGENSFETKALGDSLYTNSNVITGGATPFTIEGYYLFRPDFNTTSTGTDLSLFSLCNDSGYYQGYFLSKSLMNIGTYRSVQFSKPILDDSFINKRKIKVNEINKITISYDGSALRSFINDELDGIYGTSVGLEKSSQPLRLMSYNFNTSKNTTSGIIDNINIHDGVATKVRDYDPYEEYLVVDLAFDGENNSTKIVDNTAWELAPITPLFYPFSDSLYNGTPSGTITIQDESSPFNDKSAYFNNGYITQTNTSDYNLTNKDFTIQGWVKFDSNVTSSNNYPSMIAKRQTGTVWDWGIECNTIYKNINFVYNNRVYVNIVPSFDFNMWIHVCVTCKDGVLRTFNNGILTSTHTLTGAINYSSTTNVLVGRTSTSWSDNYLKGWMKDLMVINGFCLYEDSFDVPTSSHKLYNKWTVNGNAKISTDQKFDGFSSLYLNNGKITTSLVEPLGTSDFTINFDVIRMNDDNSNIFMWGRMLNIGNNSSQGGLYIARDSLSSNFLVDIYGNGYVRLFTTTDSPLSHNTKVNIKLVRSNGVFHLYINNILKFSNSQYTTYDISKSNVIIGGNDVNTEYLNGYIKNFKIYKGVAVIPENPTGKIQLDFDNNVIDKYGNSTWTNNGVTFDQVNSIKGHAAKFNGSNSILSINNNQNLNFENKNFVLSYDFKNAIFDSVNNRYLLGNGMALAHGAFWRLFGTSSNKYGSVNLNYNSTNYGLTNTVEVENNYYNEKILRKSNTLVGFKNDVVISALNVTSNFNIDFKNMSIGTASSLTSGVSYFNGYIDNFKATKDSQESFVIDKPAVHLPLETNAINTGFTPLTINSVGNPTYTTIEGKKCIKFESGKYLTINSNNIFNLGTNSDFYIEFDFMLDGTSTTDRYLLSPVAMWSSSKRISYLFVRNSTNKLVFQTGNNATTEVSVTSNNSLSNDTFYNCKLTRFGNVFKILINNEVWITSDNVNLDLSQEGTYIGYTPVNGYLKGYMSNFKMFVGTSEIPESYNDKKVLDLDFKPTGKSYLFKDNNNKCVIHPVNITQRDYQDSQYCCTFNGSNQYLVLGRANNFNLDIDDFVLSIDLEYASTSRNYLTILSGGSETGASENNSIMIVSNKGASNIVYNNSLHVKVAGQVIFNLPEGSLQPNIKYNLIITRQNGVFSLYIDKALVEVNNSFLRTQFNLNQADCTYIGKVGHNDTEHFQGSIYNMKLLRGTSDLTKLEPIGTKPIDPIPQLPEFDISVRPYSVLFRFDNSLVDSVSLQALTMPSGVYPKYIAGFSTEVPGSGALDIDGIPGQRTLLVPTDLKSIFNLDGDFTLGFDINVKDVTEYPLIVSSQTDSIYSMYIGLAPNTSDTSLYSVVINESLSDRSNYKNFKSKLLKFNTNVNIKVIKQGTLIRVYVNNYFIGEVEWATALNFNMYNKPLLCGYTAGGNSIPTCHLDSFFICKGYVEFSHTIKTEEDSV